MPFAFVQQMSSSLSGMLQVGWTRFRRLPSARIVRWRRPSRQGSSVRGADELRALAAAVELYANRLLADQRALGYLAGRGFARDVLVDNASASPSATNSCSYLAWRGVPVSAAKRVGLLRGDGRESLAGRIVFPEIRQRQPVWLDRSAPATGQRPAALPRVTRSQSRYWVGIRPVAIDALSASSRARLDLLALQQWGVPGLALCGTGFSTDDPATARPVGPPVRGAGRGRCGSEGCGRAGRGLRVSRDPGKATARRNGSCRPRSVSRRSCPVQQRDPPGRRPSRINTNGPGGCSCPRGTARARRGRPAQAGRASTSTPCRGRPQSIRGHALIAEPSASVRMFRL